MFFELIQVAVGNRKQLSRVPSAEEWEDMYRLAKEHAIHGVLFSAIKLLPQEQQPNSLLVMRWFGVVQKIQLKSKIAFDSCAALSRNLQQNGKRHAILKGQGMAALYPEPYLRVTGDIDVWVPGKRMETLDYFSKRTKIGSVVYHHCDARLKNDMEVEIHFTPSWMYSYRLNKRLQQYFRQILHGDYVREIPSPEGQGSFFVASLALDRIHILIHIFRHLFGEGIGLRQLMDYYYVLHQGFTEDERKETIAILKKLHLLKFAAAVMYIQQNVFGLERQYWLIDPDDNAGRFLLDEVIKSGNFGCSLKENAIYSKNPSIWSRFYSHIHHNLRFIKYFSEEVVATPFFKIWHYSWRKYHGWI